MERPEAVLAQDLWHVLFYHTRRIYNVTRPSGTCHLPPLLLHLCLFIKYLKISARRANRPMTGPWHLRCRRSCGEQLVSQAKPCWADAAAWSVINQLSGVPQIEFVSISFKLFPCTSSSYRIPFFPAHFVGFFAWKPLTKCAQSKKVI